MNAINRYELYVLDDGEKSVEITEDTKIPNAATFKILKQDHTLGNLLRAQLLQMPEVLFAGYKVPHPLRPHFLLKVQTDGSVTPTAALESAANKLIGLVLNLEGKFKREFSYREAEPTEGTDAYGGGGGGAEGGTGGAWSGRDFLDF